MRWREQLRWPFALAGVWVFLCLSLLAGGAAASTPAMAQAGPMVGAAMPPAPMPQMLDCMPCVGCYVAPAPSAQSGGGEPRHQDEAAWPVHGPAPRHAIEAADAGGRRPDMPVRILYCRWLD